MTALTDAEFYAPLKTTLVPTNGAGTPTFARATTKNIFDNEGKLITVKSGAVTFGGVRCVQNLYTQKSEDLTHPSWFLVNVTAQSSDTLKCVASTTSMWIYADSSSSVVVGDVISATFRVQYVDIRYIQLIGKGPAIDDTSLCNFDLVDGDYTSANCTATMTAVSAGIWDITFTANIIADSANFAVFFVLAPSQTSVRAQAFVGDGIKSVKIIRSQIEIITGQSVQAAGEYVSVGVLPAPWHGGGADGVKYFDTDSNGDPIPDATMLGAHIDPESKTNNLLWCRDLTNAGWVKTNATAAKTQTGIDGLANSCSLLTATAANATCLQTITTASTPACSGFWVKRSVGTGSIFFTRNGGVDWLDITNLINSSTFTCVKIENTSVTNPQVGFKIATSGDAIIVDAGLNHAGTTLTLPIFTTSAAVTRAADVLTYQTASNFSDTAGTILAKVNKSNWGLEVGSVVGDTTGLHIGTTGGISVDAKDGTNTISTTITQTNGSSGNIGMVWSGSTLKSFGNTDFGTPGSYDGSMNLSAIKIMSGASGYIRDVAIWLSALSDIEFKSAIGIITNLPLNIKKNVNSSAILLLNQAGIYSINSASIISTITKKINTTSGSNIVTIASGYDNVGLVIGGKVVNADLSINTTVTAINGRNITLNSNVSFTQSNESVTFDTEVVSPTSLISISNANFSIPAGSSIKLMRNGSLIYTFYNTSKWSLNELSQQFLGDDEITVEVPTGALVEFKLNKFGNWGNSNSSYGNI